MKKLLCWLALTAGYGSTEAQNCKGTLLERQGYRVCYVDSLGRPAWVAWSLKTSDIGTAERQSYFTSDKRLPEQFYRVTPRDYKGSGFDKGHLCSSADRTKSSRLNQETFAMSNVFPQSPNSNRITWRGLEEFCRGLAKKGYELKIVAGVYGSGGTGQQGPKKKLRGRVSVPSNAYKVVKYSMHGITHYIFADMPNIQNLSRDWQDYQTTRENLEEATGLSFENF